MKYHLYQAPVIINTEIGTKIYSLTIKAPRIAQSAMPGQFIHIRCSNSLDPLLRRPLSINTVQRDEGFITCWYQVVGKGTKLLSTVREGEALDIIGPLGRGYDTGINGKRAVLIGGGLGIAPLFFLGRELAPNNHVQALFGGRNKDAIPRFSSIKSFTYELITEDGSLGSKGLVTDLLVKLLEEDKPDIIYSCGPRPMLAAVNKIALQYNIPHQVSLESVMACGVGACLGCTCKGTSKGTNEEKIDEKNDEIGNNGDKADVLLKVCKDGPVFWAGEVQWE